MYRCRHCAATFPLTVEGAKAAADHERATHQRHQVQAPPWYPCDADKLSTVSDGSVATS